MQTGGTSPTPGRIGHWMLTFTGRAYFPCDPRPDEVDILDIAHGLSNLCRYTGQCLRFYSVAEHSILVSRMVPSELAMEALLHDASEAYCADLNRPLKVSLPDYNAAIKLNDIAVRTHFGLPLVETPAVKTADTDVLISEYRQNMPAKQHDLPWIWGGTERPEVLLYCYPPLMAERVFLDRYHELGGRVR